MTSAYFYDVLLQGDKSWFVLAAGLDEIELLFKTYPYHYRKYSEAYRVLDNERTAYRVRMLELVPTSFSSCDPLPAKVNDWTPQLSLF